MDVMGNMEAKMAKRVSRWRVAGLPLAVLSSLALVGCGSFFISREEGTTMQTELDDLKKKTKKLETENAELRKANEDAEVQLKNLVDEATRVVTRNSANLGQELDKAKSDVGVLTGRMEHVEGRVSALEQKTDANTKTLDLMRTSASEKPGGSAQPAPPKTTIPDTADALFAEAKKRYDNKEYPASRPLFDAFVTKYPADPRASSALYLVGEGFYSEGKFANAIGAFSKVVEKYPGAESAPDAMYKNGLAFYSLKYCGDARIYFQELLRRYPKSTWKRDALEQLKKLQKDMKNKDVCQS